MNEEVELGVIRQGPVKATVNAVLSVWKTWWYARKNGTTSDEWYGVYVKGTEVCVAQMGPLPGAKERALRLVALLNSET